VAVLAFGVWWSCRDRGPLTALLLFGGTLVPVLGFVNVYPFIFSYVADHFQYLASLGIIAFLTALATRGFPLFRWPRWSGPVVATGLLVVFGVLTWKQSTTYRDAFSLYETTLARNPSSWVAHLNLGTALGDAGRTEESLPHLQRALELKPDYPETLNSLGGVLNQLGRPREAQPLLERAIQIQPHFAAAHNTLGVTLMSLGQTDAGVASFKRALETNPKLMQAKVNLGWALANTGNEAEALVLLEQARREQPDNANAEIKIALTYAKFGQMSEAEPHARRAVELQPDSPDIRYVFGCVLLDLGRPADAAEQFEETLQFAPNHGGARQGLEQVRRLQSR
jgi:tetratricopeptide (TPR) repeat protein